MKKKFLQIILFFVVLEAFAQDNLQYTQYMYTMALVNPAYTLDTPEAIYTGGVFKSQWVNLQGSPQFYSFFLQSSYFENIELGLSISENSLDAGVQKESSFLLNVAYHTNISENIFLSLGLKMGSNHFSTTGFENFKLSSGSNSTDPAFAENLNIMNPNLGGGIYINGTKYYLGVSSPNFLPNSIGRDEFSNSRSTAVFLTAGYVFDITDQIKIKPSTIARIYSPNNNFVVDLSINALLIKMLDVGVAYRLDESLSFLLMFSPLTNLNFGYAYDFTTSELGVASSGSHEFLLSYKFLIFGDNSGYVKSPRFF